MKIGKIDFSAVIFDLDGTLYCSKGLKKKLFFKSLGKIPTMYQMNKVRKKLKGIDLNSEKEFFKTFYKNIAGNSEKKIKSIENWYNLNFYPAFINLLKTRFRSRKNINELLNIFRDNNVKLAVLSDYGYVAERLDALNIDKSLFEIAASNEEYGVLKPHKRPLIDIAEKLKVKPEKILIIGDRDDTDGEGARMAGMNYILIAANGKNHNENIFSWENFNNQITKMSKN